MADQYGFMYELTSMPIPFYGYAPADSVEEAWNKVIEHHNKAVMRKGGKSIPSEEFVMLYAGKMKKENEDG